MGGWMEDTEGAWLITSLTTSPLFLQLYNPVLFLPNISRTDTKCLILLLPDFKHLECLDWLENQ
ncbi:hypothetical protein [Nostoc sp.]|uniref:hypothetical protein n=1 Tax=Nostoc sp. TaxID=1180 RepID=UPI003FA5F254